MDFHQILEIVFGIVTVASVIANVVAPTNPIGKLLHILALNGPKIQKAIKQASPPSEENHKS